MYSLFLKEIRSFLSSPIAYVVIGVFLLVTSLFIWVFPDYSILEFNFANMDPLFVMAPWIFLFLIPAVTMRSFAEERKSGTIELLLTRPLTDFQIVGAKYLAGLVLVFLSLLPTFLYAVTVYRLADPIGNVDTGAMLGSYIGLFCLASAFVAIGLFSSSLTDNQIVSFVTAVFFSFFFYAAFDSLSLMQLPQQVLLVLEYLGIARHYEGMSQGVIDSRDVLYFVSLNAFFLTLTRYVLQNRYR
jgi:ABC-2 type transport system permease protein